MGDLTLTLKVKDGQITSVDAQIDEVTVSGATSQEEGTQTTFDKNRMDLAEKSFKTVLDADVHQDNKAGRILGAIAFLTGATAGVFSQAYSFKPGETEFRASSERVLSSYITDPSVRGDAVSALKEAILRTPIEIAGLNAALLTFAVFLFLVVGGAVLYLVAIGPSFNIGGDFQAHSSKVRSLLFFQFIGTMDDYAWKDFWRPVQDKEVLASFNEAQLRVLASASGITLDGTEIQQIREKEFTALTAEKRNALAGSTVNAGLLLARLSEPQLKTLAGIAKIELSDKQVQQIQQKSLDSIPEATLAALVRTDDYTKELLALFSEDELKALARTAGVQLGETEISKISEKELSAISDATLAALMKSNASILELKRRGLATNILSKSRTEELTQKMEDDYVSETKKIAEKTITKTNLLVFGSRMFKWALPLLAPLVASMFTTDVRWFLITALVGYVLLFAAFFIESQRRPQLPEYWGRTFASVGLIVLLITLVGSVALTLAGYSTGT